MAGTSSEHQAGVAEGRRAEDQRGNQGHGVRLEQVLAAMPAQ